MPRRAGGTVRSSAPIKGDAVLAGGQVDLEGDVAQGLYAAGGRMLIDGPVMGNVLVRSGHHTLGPCARIEGRLEYRGPDLVRDDAAVITGGLTVSDSSRRTNGGRDAARAGYVAAAVALGDSGLNACKSPAATSTAARAGAAIVAVPSSRLALTARAGARAAP